MGTPGEQRIVTRMPRWLQSSWCGNRSVSKPSQDMDTRPSADQLSAFLTLMHEEFTSRREAVDQRALLITAIAVGQVAAIVTLGGKLAAGYPEEWRGFVSALPLILALVAATRSLALVLPVRRTKTARKSHKSTSLTWFYDVATYESDVYLKRLSQLDNIQIQSLVATLDVEVARLLRQRYVTLIRVGRTLRVSLIVTSMILIGGIAFPIVHSTISTWGKI